MKITAKKPPKIALAGWPSDSRTTVIRRDDVTIIMHPERQPHKYDPVTKKWSPL